MIRLLQELIGRIFSIVLPPDWYSHQSVLETERETRRATVRFGHWPPGAYVGYPWNSLVGLEHVRVGARFHANKGLFLGAYGPDRGEPQITIGDDVVINFDCQITAIQSITLGNNVLVGSRVVITDHGHGDFTEPDLLLPPIQRPLRAKGPVVIGNNVWIGSGAAILPGVTLGDSCVVGANAVVTKSFPARTMVGGNPARALKRLDPV